MKPGDTIDVALHARFDESDGDPNGDETVDVIVVCDGNDIGRIGITLFGATPDDEKRRLIRKGVVQCLAGAFGVLDDIATGKLQTFGPEKMN